MPAAGVIGPVEARGATLRGLALGTLRRLDHAVGRWTSAARVLIDVRTPMNVAVLRPVWAALIRDPRIRVAFTAEDRAGVQTALRAEGLERALVGSDAARRARWDLMVTADAWAHTPLLRCRRRLQFFHGVAGKYDLDRPDRLTAAGLHQFDRLCFINEDRMGRYLASGVIRPEQAVLVGYPKIDALVNGAWSAARVRAGLGLAADRRTVLYAPTFSTASSLHLAGPALIEALLGTGSNVIVKLHDRSMVPDPKHTAGIDWPAALERFASVPLFALARAADAGPFLCAADVLVTDHSTVGFEFALLDRPIVVYDAPDLAAAARIAADKWTLLRSMSEVVDSPAAAVEAVLTALAHPARLRERRAEARRLFAYPGDATRRALAVVYELLELQQPRRDNDAPAPVQRVPA